MPVPLCLCHTTITTWIFLLFPNSYSKSASPFAVNLRYRHKLWQQQMIYSKIRGGDCIAHFFSLRPFTYYIHDISEQIIVSSLQMCIIYFIGYMFHSSSSAYTNTQSRTLFSATCGLCHHRAQMEEAPPWNSLHLNLNDPIVTFYTAQYTITLGT